MNTKSEWQSVSREMLAEDRRRIAPPTTEEMFAYTRGALSPDEEQSVRERLVRYPELVRTLTVPFPTEGATSGDDDYVSDDEYPAHWAALQKRMGRSKVTLTPRVWLPLAAGLALLFGALFWQAEWKVRRLQHQLSEPRVVTDQRVLLPDGQRGGGEVATTVTPDGDSVLLIAPIIGETIYPEYRLKIADGTGHVLWSSAALPAPNGDAFAVLVPRTFLRRGSYQMVLYGISGGHEQEVARYSIRVP